MFAGKSSGNRTFAASLCRAVVGACLLTALCALAPTFGQSLPSVAGLLNDGLSHPPPATGPYAYNSFVPALTIGASYVDPVFGTTVRRITTDHMTDNLYARNMWWNADETRYFHYGKIINLVTNTVEYTGLPLGSSSPNVGFDPVDPNVYYYYSGASIHKVTLQAGGTWTDAIYFTAPGGATILDLGGTLNWFDASGRYMVVRYGAEPSVHLYDRQTLAAGPYANPIDATNYVNRNGYIGITPDGKYLVGADDSPGSGYGGGVGALCSWAIDHVNRSVAATRTMFWNLGGDHASFISASDGRDYAVTYDPRTNFIQVFRADVTNNAVGLTEAQEQALPNNRLLIQYPTWNDGGHMSATARGPLQDWAFAASEDGSDGFNSGTADANGNITPWHAYRQEITAVNVVTGEVRRVAHHRSRGGFGDYFSAPRVSASWGAKYVGFASNFNQSGVDDIYAAAFALTSDTTPPTVAITAPSSSATVSGTVVTVSASASDNIGVAGVQFKLDGVNLGAEVTATPYSVSWNTTLGADGAHTLTAVARDAAGNTATSAAVSVTVDNTPPVISTVSASSISSAGALITWATNEASDSQVDYGLTTAYGSSTPLNSSLLTAHAVTLSGLLATTTYHYRVKSRDAAGNLATSADFTFATLVLSADTTPPSVPTNLSASAVSSSQINLSWTASTDNVGVSGYAIYRGGSQIATTALTSYSDTGLSPSTAYTYTVAAYDAAGNVSAQSAPASTVTLPPPSLSLVAAYGLNEGSGPFTVDASSNSNTGTLNGAAWTTAGKYGYALSFNGTSNYVEAADINALTPGTGATFEAWVFLNSAPTEIASVFNKWSQTVDDEYLLGINPNQTLFFAWQTTGGGAWGTSSYNGASGTGLIPLNAWTHIAVVRSGATLSFYLNGQPDMAYATAMDTNAFRNGINTLRQGGQGRGGMNRFVNGRLDELRMYNRALSQVEIQNDMNTPIGAPPPDTTPPTVSLTAPSNGATVSGNAVTVSATASDNVWVASVQFQLDGAPLGAELTTAPYTLSWTTTTASNGAHTLTAVARDAAGNTATSSGVTVTVSNDTTPPTVSITAPAAGAPVSGTVTVSASATDNVGVVGVQFKLDGANLGAEVLAAPYSLSWNSTGATNGSHTLTAVARDAAGNTATSTAVAVTVDNIPPTVSITAPAAGASVSGTVTVSATATDNVGVVGVQFKLDGANLGAEVRAAPYATSWNTALAAIGAHTLTAVARDAAGNTATSAAVSVTVSNPVPDITPPSVPTNLSARAVSSAQITLSWTASTDNVGVSGYTIYRGGSQIATTSMTSYSDTGLSPSTTYTYTVAAYDAAGNVSAQSAAASAVTLAPPSLSLVAAYGFNEGSGSVTADASSNSNTGTINGAAWSPAGKFGNALSFNGTSNYVEAADINALTPGTGATFEAWVFLTSAPTELTSVFNKWSQTIDDEYLFGINPNQTLFFAWHTSGGGAWGTTSYNLASGTRKVPLNAWTHIVVVRSGATLNFYINGNLDASLNAMDTHAFRNGINTLRLGGQGRGGKNRFLKGRLDEMRIYTRALSQTEIQNDMNTAIAR